MGPVSVVVTPGLLAVGLDGLEREESLATLDRREPVDDVLGQCRVCRDDPGVDNRDCRPVTGQSRLLDRLLRAGELDAVGKLRWLLVAGFDAWLDELHRVVRFDVPNVGVPPKLFERRLVVPSRDRRADLPEVDLAVDLDCAVRRDGDVGTGLQTDHVPVTAPVPRGGCRHPRGANPGTDCL